MGAGKIEDLDEGVRDVCADLEYPSLFAKDIVDIVFNRCNSRGIVPGGGSDNEDIILAIKDIYPELEELSIFVK